ncbi:hypothetical protein FIB18_16120 [Brucella pecoris]|uniref:Uncharacterized protein n=2 Tax=Brucella pecoris TaxID=867683 RepID=A0A5C5CHT0_9HYPH|nr:hypothetical protein FIB18_16120 [Brucella pecoris]
MSRSHGEQPMTLVNRKYPFQVVLFLTEWHRTEESQQEFIRLYGGVPYGPTDKKSKSWETSIDR